MSELRVKTIKKNFKEYVPLEDYEALEKELGQYKRSDKVLKGGIEWRDDQLQKLREGIDKRYQDIKEAFEREGEANEWVDGRWNLIREIDELLKQ